jgi:hypothetical protein
LGLGVGWMGLAFTNWVCVMRQSVVSILRFSIV